jgi:hypothetical protein
MMLHIPECLKCKSKNIFYEPDLIKRHSISNEISKNAEKMLMECLDGEETTPSNTETREIESGIKFKKQEKKCENCNSEACKCLEESKRQ